MTEALDHPDDAVDTQKKEVKEGRLYQVELLEHSLRENTIVNLGTGAGKTFVAVMLIRELGHQTTSKFTDDNGQRTIFLAHTVPLVKQQADYIRDNTSLNVKDFCADNKGIDNWPKDKWYAYFNECNVLVMIHQIFLDLLNRAFIKPRQLNLIVFDECHHATKNHPYVQIMKVIKDAPVEERPRILGLSASLLGKKVKPGELSKGVKGLEEILMSHARTSQDLNEVIKHATAPIEKITNFTSSVDEVTGLLKNIIKKPLEFLRTKKPNIKSKSSLGEVAKNLIEDLLNILVDLGPASAAEFIGQALKELRKAMLLAVNESHNEYDYMLACLGLTHLTIFDGKCREFKEMFGRLNDSQKVQALFLELADMAIQSGECGIDSSEGDDSPKLESASSRPKRDEELRGIIFVERRYTASSLAKLIQRKRKEQKDMRHIKCDYVVGHNVGQNATSVRKEARMKSTLQDQVLRLFRKGRINLLIATNVIEEGVDVPRCNLVVRFDLPQNFRSYVQSKGRARCKPSTFLLLIGDHQMNKMMDIGNYHLLEKELIAICQEDREIPSEESIQAKMKDKIPPYMPNGREGARATVGNSLTILHRYCQKLPHDDYTILTPVFRVTKLPKDNATAGVELYSDEEDEDPKHDYICRVSLPMNCPLKETIESPIMSSKRQSERAAARYVVEKLHKMEELNDDFRPTPSVDSDDDEIKEEKKSPIAGTDKRSSFYKNEVAVCLKNCFPQPLDECFLYVFIIREVSSGKLYQTLNDEGPHTMIGILLKNQISYWKIPKFSLYIKNGEGNEKETELLVSVQPVPGLDPFPSEDLEVFKSCHQSIFSDVLKIIPPCLVSDFDHSEKSYLVVPVAIKRLEGDEVMEGSVNYELATILADMSQSTSPQWPYPVEKLTNVLVCRTLDSTTNVGMPELHEVTVDNTITPLSRFPVPSHASFKDYYKSHHNYDVKDLQQPGLKARRVSVSSLKLITSRFASTTTPLVKSSGSLNSITLFPEIVQIYPIPANIWKLLRCVPSLFWRLESLLLVEELSAEANLGSLEYDTLIFTDATLKGYRDAGFGELSSQMFKIDDTIPRKIDVDPTAKDLFSRGPDNGLLLQALTPKGANDSVNLERLELLGDSFLKLSASIFLVNSRKNDHEGRLSSARSRRVSNLKLFFQAARKNIIGKILANDLTMGADSIEGSSKLDRLKWIPSGYTLKSLAPELSLPEKIVEDGNLSLLSDEVKKYFYRRITDKTIADCMEALIGACTVAAGIEGGLKLIKWLDIDIMLPNDVVTRLSKDPNINISTTEELVPLIIDQSSYIFHRHLNYHSFSSDVKNREEFNRLLSMTAKVQREINYNFENHLLLIEAMTHPSYARNSITDCYQRLEFLGDAVLDYLITCHIYAIDQAMTTGTMTELRSAVVSNLKFAEVAVGLRLHQNMLHSSPGLFKEVGKYAAAVREKRISETTEGMEGMSLEEVDGSQVLSPEDDDIVASTDEEDEDDDDDDRELLDPPKALSDILESLVGAVFMDTGMSLDKTWKVFKPHLKPLIDEYHGDIPVPPIRQLYEMVPTGVSVKKRILSGHRYGCVIKVQEKGIGATATAKSYKNAKNLAAKKVLSILRPHQL